jgi:hypothetical protein
MRALKSKMRRAVSLTAGAVLVLAGGGAAAAGATPAAAARPAHLSSDAPVTVVAQGLNNPRSLAWGPHGHLLVAEAGTLPTDCVGTHCFGVSGSISDVSSGTPVRIATGLATLSESGEVIGPDGLAYTGGRLYTVEGKSRAFIADGLPADLTATLRRQLGAVIRIDPHGRNTPVSRPGDVDYAWAGAHKDLAPGDFPDADPYALTPGPLGGLYVVDAGSNTLDYVSWNGHVSVLAFIPNTAAGPNSVPTCVAQGPDGAVYVGELGRGTTANVYRYQPLTRRLSVWQSGFAAITGCGFGANGDFYVTELTTEGFPPTGFPAGAVVQVARNGERTVLGAGTLVAPEGFLAGRDGSIYVSNNTLFPGTGPVTGQVVKIG